MKKLNNKGFSLIELLVTVFIISVIALMILNYSSIQKDAFTYKNLNNKTFGLIANELADIYAEPDWSILSKDEEDEDGIRIMYSDYNTTAYGTEQLKLTVQYLDEEWVYELEKEN